MNPTVNRQSEALIDSIVDPIQSDLAIVDSILRQELQSDIDAVNEMLDHPLFWNGKRIRPILLLLTGRSSGRLSHQHHLLAAVLEMIHAATLVHDDVLDEAEIRRHCPSVNRQWGNQLSVLLGDFLFSHAFYLASTLDSTYPAQQIGLATNAVCAGEMLQITSQGNMEITERDYLRMIDGKTARLCATACQLGAYSSGLDRSQIEAFTMAGLKYGRAFQIVDDILDLRGAESTVGKSLGTDVKQKKLTLPLIYALEQTAEPERTYWKTALADRQLSNSELTAWLETRCGFDYATQQARRYVQQASTAIRSQVGETAAAPLERLGSFILKRNR